MAWKLGASRLNAAPGTITDMSGSERDDLLLRLWEEHRYAKFPAHLRDRVVDGVDIVPLDTDIAGCVPEDRHREAHRPVLKSRSREIRWRLYPSGTEGYTDGG